MTRRKSRRKTKRRMNRGERINDMEEEIKEIGRDEERKRFNEERRI
jgi:hypothetical protein